MAEQKKFVYVPSRSTEEPESSSNQQPNSQKSANHQNKNTNSNRANSNQKGGSWNQNKNLQPKNNNNQNPKNTNNPNKNAPTKSNNNNNNNNSKKNPSSTKAPSIKDFVNPVFPFVDTHMHLDLIFSKISKQEWSVEQYNQIIKSWEEMSGSNMLGFLNVVCFPESFMSAEWQLQNLQDDTRLFLSFGIHPHAAKDYNPQMEKRMIDLMEKYPKKIIAWGEMGLDYFKNFSPHEIQRQVFERQLTVAVGRKMPLIIHTRDADQDTFDIMSKVVPADYDSIHFHCFGGNLKFANQLLKYFKHCFFGFTGACTFNSADSAREVIAFLPLEKILLETDGPFMAPNGFRGQTAHPGHLPWIVDQIAKVKKVDVQTVARQTTLNAHRMYKVFPPSNPYQQGEEKTQDQNKN